MFTTANWLYIDYVFVFIGIAGSGASIASLVADKAGGRGNGAADKRTEQCPEEKARIACANAIRSYFSLTEAPPVFLTSGHDWIGRSVKRRFDRVCAIHTVPY